MVAFNDVNLDIEWMWNGGKDHFPSDVILAQTTGLQGGNISAVHFLLVPQGEFQRAHDAREQDPERIQSLIRSEWGIRFVHELIRDRALAHYPLPGLDEEKRIRAFGYGAPEVEVVNYWAPEEKSAGAPALESRNGAVKWIGCWKEKTGELLAVLVNWDKTEQKTAFRVNGKFPAAIDERGGEVKLDALSFAPFEVKILAMRP